MKIITVAAITLFLCGVASAQVPDFSKMTTVTINESSKTDTAYDWKVDDWPADPNVHQTASYVTSSVFLESNGWHFIADCMTPIFVTIPCRQIPSGVHEVQWKGRIVYNGTAMYPDGSERRGQAYGPASVTVLWLEGTKRKKVTYRITAYNLCTSEKQSERACYYYDIY